MLQPEVDRTRSKADLHSKTSSTSRFLFYIFRSLFADSASCLITVADLFLFLPLFSSCRGGCLSWIFRGDKIVILLLFNQRRLIYISDADNNLEFIVAEPGLKIISSMRGFHKFQIIVLPTLLRPKRAKYEIGLS